MELDELQVLYWQPRPICHGQAIASGSEGVGGEAVHAAGTAGSEDQRLAPEEKKLAAGQVPDGKTPELSIFHED